MGTFRVLDFRGDIDVVVKPWIDRELEQIERFEDGALAILDLTSVRYLDTTFLNALMRVRNRMARQKSNVRICLVAPPGGVASHLFEITKLGSTFSLFEDVASARRNGGSAPRNIPRRAARR